MVTSRVSGWIEVEAPAGRGGNLSAFRDEVRRAVESLRYHPTLRLVGDVVCFTTPETLEQAGRGSQGFDATQELQAFAPVPKSELGADGPDTIGAEPEAGEQAFIEAEAALGINAWVNALKPNEPPRMDRLSEHSELKVWHTRLVFDRYEPSASENARWAQKSVRDAQTWGKSPLLIGRESGCGYSCGEIEIAARLRKAGYDAYWISEWSAFPHVRDWEPWCVKRTELRGRLPSVWEFDRRLRNQFQDLALDQQGGHPDVVAWSASRDELFYVEYKGPSDRMKPKQNRWAQALSRLDPDVHRYVAARGIVD